MTIYGIGTDICDIRRIGAALERHGERFAHKVLSEHELSVWRSRSARWPARGVAYVATRFSAKEALSKALGLGLRWPMHWHNCQVVNLPSGAPTIEPLGALLPWWRERGLRARLSMSDEGEYAVSFCIVERDSLAEHLCALRPS